MERPRVFVASPLRGMPEHLSWQQYVDACLADCFERGEHPYAPHPLYADGVLDDDIPAHRNKGIAAGVAFLSVCDVLAVYVDHGISDGMRLEITSARSFGLCVVYRKLGEAGQRVDEEAQRRVDSKEFRERFTENSFDRNDEP